MGLPYKMSGYVVADFDSLFVLASSSGMQNPIYIWLYEMETGTDILPMGGALIDVDRINQVLLYSVSDVPSEADSITLFDTKKMTQKEYPFPKEIFEEPNKLNRIKLLELTEKSFTIECQYQDRNITKSRKCIRED